jgi:hypothetical protein
MLGYRVQIAAVAGVLILLDLFVALMVYKEAAGSGTRIAVGLLAASGGLGLAALFPRLPLNEPAGQRPGPARSLYAASAGGAVVLLALGRTWQVAGLGIVLGILAGSTPPLLRRRSQQLERFRRS